ncbi:replication initiation negative regulator SeqA [Rosenbergiella australiborealis]|uniref:Negative modulator of initiation of replication n=1 Tax=Rosenbergiella australiborealis TaxID=1544696 RepID=A0ABS5T3Y4_9GAMM|nr:replication initiation negative regulator SeqA [Rosenbergiella australiborealis]MBT0727064.1 replication initiation negative regulator SeqA [Rosenbergiella australiborealis]
MKTIEIDDDLYRYIASHTQHIGESASEILRRMLQVTEQTLLTAESSVVIPEAAPKAKAVNDKKPAERVRAVRELLLSDEYAEQKRAVNRFMLILSTLYQLDTEAFAQATQSMQGRTRLYFAGDELTLLQSGNHTKPKHIAHTPYWVITNTNTGRKCSMIEHIMQTMKLPQELTDKVCGTL